MTVLAGFIGTLAVVLLASGGAFWWLTTSDVSARLCQN